MKYDKYLKLNIEGVYDATMPFDIIKTIGECGMFVEYNGRLILNGLFDGYKIALERKAYIAEFETTVVYFELVKEEN